MMLKTDTNAFIEGAVEQIDGFVGGLFGSFISIILNLRVDTEVVAMFAMDQSGEIY